MLWHPKGPLIASAFLIAAVWLCGVSYSWTCPGSENETNSGGNYPLGCPMGGIGGGNFNFLPNGTYSTLWCQVTADAGAPPTCYAFQKRGATVFSATLQNAGSMTTTYTGYWPTVTMQYTQTGINDALVLKCFSPIIAGDGIASDNENSSLPIAIYKFTLTNAGTTYDTAAIALSNGANATIVKNTAGAVIGIKSTTVCVMADTTTNDPADSITCGSSVTGFNTTGLLNNGAAGYLAKRVVVGPNSTGTITFCVSWTNISNGYYRNYFTDAQTLATYGVTNAATLEAKVDNWHNKILNSNLPSWLQDLAINCLHVYNSMTDWTNVTSNGVSGSYGMAESMSSGNYGTNDQAYHAHFALACFAPQAEWSQVARMSGAQLSSGLFGHLYNNTDIRSDVGQKFLLETYKTYQWTGNTTYLNLMYPFMKKTIAGVISEDNNGDGLTDDNAQTTYDNPFSEGWTFPSKEFDNELYLGALKAVINAAQATNNTADIAAYNADFTKTSTGFERANNATIASSGFWNASIQSSSGKTGYYTGSSNIAPGATTASKGTCVWDGALMGQWCADVCGLGPLHPESRIESCLDVMNDACLDQHNPPVYSMMMAYPNVNNTGTPTSTYFGAGSYVQYSAYGAGDLCAAFGHKKPDYGMRALHSFWNEVFGKYLRVYNVECKMLLSGAASTDWGADRYMNTPACFAALFGITGFTIDVYAKTLRIKPSLPTSTQYALAGDSLKAAPLMNPISCGTVDYKKNTSNGQRFFVRFDNPMTFNTFYCGKVGGTQTVAVFKSGANVSPTISVNSADTSEYAVSFGSDLQFDNTGVGIYIGNYPVPVNAPARAIKVQDFLVNMKQGKISYSLPQGESVKISLVNAQGSERTLFNGRQAPGNHSVKHDWKNEPAGIYYVTLTAGDSKTVRRLVHVQ